MAADSCANCACFSKPKRSEEQTRAAQERGMDTAMGRCRRYPEEIPKREDDWCFEHKRRK